MNKEFRNIEKNCETCGTKLILNNSRDVKRKRFCSRKCTGIWIVKTGLLHCDFSETTRQRMRESKLKLLATGWKTVGWKNKDLPLNIVRGYYFKGSTPQHRIIAEKMIGRKLYPNELVHHKDFNKLNNSPENLVVMPRNEHIKLHSNERILQSQSNSITV